jgi:hypothetical protein
MTNDQMKANRFANFARYRKFVAKVRAAIEAGHKVNIQAGWTVMPFTKKNAECLKATKSGVFVQRGKSWVCIMDRAVAPVKVWAE